jgi:hypothetical protein
MHVNQRDSKLLMVKSQINILTFGPCFGHNLFYKYSNGSYKTILDIYVLKAFQWYKKLFNLMIFDLLNCALKIQESIGTSIPKVGIHLGMCGLIPSHFFTFLGV